MSSTIFHILKLLYDFFILNSLECIFLNICDLAIIHPLIVRGGETVVSERWVMPTNVELEKGGAREGGVVELGERMIDGGLCFGLKVEALSCVLHVGERQSVGRHFGGKRRQRAVCGGMAKTFIGF